MKKIVLTFSLFIALLSQTFAQMPEGLVTYEPDRYFYVNLDINAPMANTEWLKSTSVRGLKAGYRQFITRSFSAGIDIGWANYNQYFPTTTFEYASGAITTDYFNYITSFSVAGSLQYSIKTKSKIFFPYAGVGIGAMNNEYTQYYNIYTDKDKSWGFLTRPEAGVLIRLSKRRAIGGMVAIHYDYSTNKSEINGYSNFSSVGIQLGIMFMDWKFGTSDSY